MKILLTKPYNLCLSSRQKYQGHAHGHETARHIQDAALVSFDDTCSGRDEEGLLEEEFKWKCVHNKDIEEVFKRGFT